MDHCFSLRISILFCLLVYVDSALQEPLSAWRQARADLKAEIRRHQAVQGLLPPTEDSEHPFVKVLFEFWPYKVFGVDEILQSITTVSYLQVLWQDKDLAWNASDFHGVSTVTLNYDEVWHPNVMVMNAAEGESLIPHYVLPMVRLTNDGTFIFMAPVFLKTSCVFDLTYYPFDTQMCVIQFIAFFDECETRLVSAQLLEMPDPFNLGGEWTIQERDVTLLNYTSRQFNQPVIRVTLQLKRSISYYILSVMAPMILTAMMSSLVFFIPPASGEKVSFLVSIFISNSVFLSFMVASMPRSLTELPRIALFLLVVMGECFFALLATLFVIQRHHEESEHPDKHHLGSGTNVTHSNISTVAREESHLPSSHLGDESTGKESCLPINKKLCPSTTRKIAVFSEDVLDKKYVSQNGQACRPKQRMTAKQWDRVFFALYHLTGLPFYVVLFFL